MDTYERVTICDPYYGIAVQFPRRDYSAKIPELKALQAKAMDLINWVHPSYAERILYFEVSSATGFDSIKYITETQCLRNAQNWKVFRHNTPEKACEHLRAWLYKRHQELAARIRELEDQESEDKQQQQTPPWAAQYHRAA